MNMEQAKLRLESWYNGENVEISPELLDCAYKAIIFYLKSDEKIVTHDNDLKEQDS